jgi:hypothetical protein
LCCHYLEFSDALAQLAIHQTRPSIDINEELAERSLENTLVYSISHVKERLRLLTGYEKDLEDDHTSKEVLEQKSLFLF